VALADQFVGLAEHGEGLAGARGCAKVNLQVPPAELGLGIVRRPEVGVVVGGQ